MWNVFLLITTTVGFLSKLHIWRGFTIISALVGLLFYLKIWSSRLLPWVVQGKLGAYVINLVGIHVTSKIFENFMWFVLFFWLFLGIGLLGTFWWWGNSRTRINLGNLEFSFLKNHIFLVPFCLWPFLLFGLLINIYRAQPRNRSLSLEAQINPILSLLPCLLGKEYIVLCRCCCLYFCDEPRKNQKYITEIHYQKESEIQEAQSLPLGLTFEGRESHMVVESVWLPLGAGIDPLVFSQGLS